LAVSAEFDSAVTMTGRLTLKLSTTNETGRGSVRTVSTAGTSLSATEQGVAFRLKPSTTYLFKCYVKTNNVAANSAFLNLF
jgi:hypothetical protein